MKILIVAPHVPAPRALQAGERLVFELIRQLAVRHEIHLVVRIERGYEESTGSVDGYCRKVYPVFYNRPARRDFFGAPRVAWSYYLLCRKANQITAREAFDVIHAEWTETGLFLKRRKARMVIEAHDVLSKPMERRVRNARGAGKVFFLLLAGLTRAFERRMFTKFETVCVLSESDRAHVRALAPGVSTAVLRYPAGLGFSETGFAGKEPVLLFVGAMDRGPNVEAVLYFWNRILPLVRKTVPGVRFLVAGSRPLPEVRALAERDNGTVVTGFVEDIEACYRKAWVFVGPLLTGGGIIVKILDALAVGIPVVTTTIGNEGIGATPDRHLLIADTPDVFAEQVVRLLQNESLRERLGRAGKEFVHERFSRDGLRTTLEAVYPA